MIGSHMDSVANGGKLDGAYGVVAGLEAMLTLAEYHITGRYEPVLAAFTNEEGSLFPYPFFGSLAIAGRTPETTAEFREALFRSGGDPANLHRAAWSPDDVAAYLELHIEQGPILERMHLPIGIVDGIVGRTIFEIDVHGTQNHAGTTPMGARSDALVTASRLVLTIDEVTRRYGLCSVGTVGRLDVEPGMTNVIPGKVSLSAELRDVSPDNIARAEAAVLAALRDIEASSGAQVEAAVTMRAQPVPTDPELRAVIAAAADSLHLPYTTMPSGAGHDAQIIASLAPIGMIFVPSKDGISHNAAENTAIEDLINGANVLTAAIATLITQTD